MFALNVTYVTNKKSTDRQLLNSGKSIILHFKPCSYTYAMFKHKTLLKSLNYFKSVQTVTYVTGYKVCVLGFIKKTCFNNINCLYLAYSKTPTVINQLSKYFVFISEKLTF